MFTKFFVRVTVKPKGAPAHSVRHVFEGPDAFKSCLSYASFFSSETSAVLDVSISACDIYSTVH